MPLRNFFRKKSKLFQTSWKSCAIILAESEGDRWSSFMSEDPIIHIIDDEVALSEVLVRVLQDVGLKGKTYKNGIEFLQSYTEGSPGCIVTDIRMPGMSGTELVDRVKKMRDPIPMLVLSGFADVTLAVRLMKAGVRDVIEKGVSTQLLIDAIQKAVAEDREYRLNQAGRLEWRSRMATLTARESDVLHAVVDGKTNKEIAVELGISANTVEIHRSRVMEKMQARNLADLIKGTLRAEQDSLIPKAG